MRTALCDRFGIDYPIFAFTPSEKVAAAVTRAGGMGVLGCVRFNHPDELEATLQWMDENTVGKPYGVDIVMPAKIPTEGTAVDIEALIPQTHREFVAKTLADLGVPPLPDDLARSEGALGWLHSVARSHVDVALTHPIKLIANALGSPPTDVIDQAHAAGVAVAALAGSAKHARRHAANGVDIVIAQGSRSRRAHRRHRLDGPVAGGRRRGRGQAAGARGRRDRHRTTGRCGARAGGAGVWMGSVWLTAAEYDLGVRDDDGRSVIQEAPARRDLERHRAQADLLGQAGSAAQEPMDRRVGRRERAGAAADAPAEHPGQRGPSADEPSRHDPTAVAMPVGQIVGRMNVIRPVADIIAELVSGFEAATRTLDDIRDS